MEILAISIIAGSRPLIEAVMRRKVLAIAKRYGSIGMPGREMCRRMPEGALKAFDSTDKNPYKKQGKGSGVDASGRGRADVGIFCLNLAGQTGSA